MRQIDAGYEQASAVVAGGPKHHGRGGVSTLEQCFISVARSAPWRRAVIGVRPCHRSRFAPDDRWLSTPRDRASTVRHARTPLCSGEQHLGFSTLIRQDRRFCTSPHGVAGQKSPSLWALCRTHRYVGALYAKKGSLAIGRFVRQGGAITVARCGFFL